MSKSETGNPVQVPRVMHVVSGQVRSGVESVVLNLADCLRSLGADPVLLLVTEGPFGDEARERGFVVKTLEKKWSCDPFRIPKLARFIADYDIDIVHSHEVFGLFYSAPASRLARVPGHVCTFHVHSREMLKDCYRSRIVRFLAYRYPLWLTRWCDQVISVSHRLREELIRDGVPAEKVVVIPNVVDVQKYACNNDARASARAVLGLAEGTTVVGTLARLEPIKNLSMLLRAAKPLIDSGRAVHVLIAGEGPERLRLEQLASELGISQNVSFPGWCRDVPRLLSVFDIEALTSRSEGRPTAILEAMAAAKPVVATDVGGVSELVSHGLTGLLVPSEDLDAFVESLSRLIDDKTLAKEMGEAGQQRVLQNFSLANFAPVILDLYRGVLSRHSRATHRSLYTPSGTFTSLL